MWRRQRPNFACAIRMTPWSRSASPTVIRTASPMRIPSDRKQPGQRHRRRLISGLRLARGPAVDPGSGPVIRKATLACLLMNRKKIT